MKYYSISQFAKEIGVRPETLRTWESKCILLPHHRSPTGYRYYSEEQKHSYYKNSCKDNHINETCVVLQGGNEQQWSENIYESQQWIVHIEDRTPMYEEVYMFDLDSYMTGETQFGNPKDGTLVGGKTIQSRYNLQFIFYLNDVKKPFYTSSILMPGECTDVSYTELIGYSNCKIKVTCIAYSPISNDVRFSINSWFDMNM